MWEVWCVGGEGRGRCGMWELRGVGVGLVAKWKVDCVLDGKR